ncbi:hypothetical protein SmB9_17660 [Sphingosinicella microcystinivorans]|uniref:Uncharacterized protein n=1 Tax=Sphingosinicella microcystinivorans TaxID=335406 RepID=A0AAD1G0T6_SPHMI|nr:hypothetical protein SmB9_17660 [Sphingosinicella microcystinivorans]
MDNRKHLVALPKVPQYWEGWSFLAQRLVAPLRGVRSHLKLSTLRGNLRILMRVPVPGPSVRRENAQSADDGKNQKCRTCFERE